MARDGVLQKRGNDPCPLIVSIEGRNNVLDCRHPQSSNWTIRLEYTCSHRSILSTVAFPFLSPPAPLHWQTSQPDLCSPREKCLSNQCVCPHLSASLCPLRQMPWAPEHKAGTLQKMTRPDSNSKLSLSIHLLTQCYSLESGVQSRGPLEVEGLVEGF